MMFVTHYSSGAATEFHRFPYYPVRHRTILYLMNKNKITKMNNKKQGKSCLSFSFFKVMIEERACES